MPNVRMLARPCAEMVIIDSSGCSYGRNGSGNAEPMLRGRFCRVNGFHGDARARSGGWSSRSRCRFESRAKSSTASESLPSKAAMSCVPIERPQS